MAPTLLESEPRALPKAVRALMNADEMESVSARSLPNALLVLFSCSVHSAESELAEFNRPPSLYAKVNL